jgi:hypothetical protein
VAEEWWYYFVGQRVAVVFYGILSWRILWLEVVFCALSGTGVRGAGTDLVWENEEI